jgi:site-specific DNA-cytosine methylase
MIRQIGNAVAVQVATAIEKEIFAAHCKDAVREG